MPTFVIALTDFVTDPEDRADLASMPENEAASRVKKALSFLPPSAQVSIKKGVATIALAEATAKRTNEALKKYARAQKHALRGEYAAAIELYQQVLEDLPGHIEARRNLAMAQLESGRREESKGTLAQVLRLDPKDAWTYVLLGNICTKHENDPVRGERYYRRAWELNPKDAILLTNLGAMSVERGLSEQAEESFNRAIEANADYPHPYYGRALLEMQLGKPQAAIATLDSMFWRPTYADLRAAPMYREARKLYGEANERLAEETHDETQRFIDDRVRSVQEQTGYPIELCMDNSLEYVSGVTELAWNHGRDRHTIKYRDKGPVATPHLIAHELEHIILEYESRQAGRGRSFATSPETMKRATDAIADHVYKLRDAGYKEDGLASVMSTMLKGLANQLFNVPVDLVLEHRMFESCTALRPSQFVSMRNLNVEALAVLTDKDIKRLTPPGFLGQA